MKCDVGRLQAYVDGALAGQELAAVEDHLANCAACRADLAALRQREISLVRHLEALDALRHDAPDVAQALAHFRTRVQPARTSRWAGVKERIQIMRQTLLTGRWRPATIGVVALGLLIALFSFAPARQAAAQFLGVFRVRKFAVIPIDPAQVQRLEDLGNQLDAGTFGEPTFLREPGEPQAVADAAEASALAGFNVRVPETLPDGATLHDFTVEMGPAMRYEVDPALMQVVLDAAGVENVTLPVDAPFVVEVDVPMMATQTYRFNNRRLTVGQLPSPTVDVPPGIDPAAMGELLLRFLGMPADDAHRMAQNIDWTSTLVIPFPTQIGQFHEVEVDGAMGLLLEETYQGQPTRQSMVLWERDGILYTVQAQNVDSTELLMVADSLR